MPLTDYISTLSFDSGDHISDYYLGFEERRDGNHMARLYWQEGDDQHWQCFTARSAVEDDGTPIPVAELIDWAKGTIIAHRLEAEGTFINSTVPPR